MYCTYCKDNGKSGKFVTGCNNCRLDALKSHKLSEQHKAAKSIAERPVVTKCQAANAIIQLKSHDNARMNILFRNAHCIAKYHMSFKSCTILCKLDKAKWLDVGESYLNDKKAAEFVHHIADVSRDTTIKFLSSTNFISLTCDGTSDYTGEEYESLFVRTSMKGKNGEKYLNIGTAESASSEDIFKYIKSDIWEKLIGFVSDGASNMQGN